MDWENDFYQLIKEKKMRVLNKIRDNDMRERIEAYIEYMTQNGYAPTDYSLVNYTDGEEQDEFDLHVFVRQKQCGEDIYSGEVYIAIEPDLYLKLEY